MRDNLIATGKSKVFVASNGGSREKLSLWPFCGWIRGPTKAIWARFDLKRKTMDILPVEPGGSTLVKKTTKLRCRDLRFAEVSKIPRMQLEQQAFKSG